MGNEIGVGANNQYVSWTVTSLAQSWVDGVSNYGLALLSKNESTIGWRGFASKERTPSASPRLVVIYRP